MEAEYAIARRGFKLSASLPYEVWEGDGKILIVSGIGLVNASLAFAWAARNYDFSEALNIGAAGSTGAVKCRKSAENPDDLGDAEILSCTCGELKYGAFYEIGAVSCIEPYNEKEYALSRTGVRLATSSRPAQTAAERAYAAKKGDLVDMEGYAFAAAAELFSKKIRIVKMVSDFSPECDIHENIMLLRTRLAEINLWDNF